jgi:hypothetical protein
MSVFFLAGPMRQTAKDHLPPASGSKSKLEEPWVPQPRWESRELPPIVYMRYMKAFKIMNNHMKRRDLLWKEREERGKKSSSTLSLINGIFRWRLSMFFQIHFDNGIRGF